jgi:hypothetical protein
MIRPFTCICLVLAAGSGLYLYQVKQRAFALDADLRSTFHGIDVAREKTRMLRADWALMNDPERLQALATQYLTLKPMGPSQLMTLDQVAIALPAPVAPSAATPAVLPEETAPAIADPTHGVPMASAAPLSGTADQAVALLQPQAAAPAAASDTTPAVDLQAQDGTDPAAMDAITVLPPDVAPPPPPGPAPAPRFVIAAPASLPAHPAVRHVQTAAVSRMPVVSQSALAAATAPHASAAVQKARAAHRTTQPPAGQLYAANEPVRQPYIAPRITPSAATVMYRPVSSSLGMAGSGTLAPPRPLYATSQ